MSLASRPTDIGFPVRTNKNVPVAKNIGPSNKENIPIKSTFNNANKENVPSKNVQTNKQFDNVSMKPTSTINNANKENPTPKNVMFGAKENPTPKNIMQSATKEKNVSVKNTPIGSMKKGNMSKGCGSGFDDSYWSDNKENVHPNFFDPVQSPYVTKENILANTSNSSTKSKANPFRELNLSNSRKSTPTARKEGIRKLDEKPREPIFHVPEKELPKPQLEKPSIFGGDSSEDSDLSFSF